MKKPSIVVAAAVMIGFFGAMGAAAQDPGPQGAGAEKITQSSHAPRSYNPMKWMKKSPSTAAEKPKKMKDTKPSEKSLAPDARVKPEKA